MNNEKISFKVFSPKNENMDLNDLFQVVEVTSVEGRKVCILERVTRYE